MSDRALSSSSCSSWAIVALRAPPVLAAAAIAIAACGGSTVRRPRMVQQPASALFEVPYPPPPARVEVVPSAPRPDAVWIDGEWMWRGRRWGWQKGRWVVPPANAAFAPWTSVRNADGTLFMAQGSWRDAKGAEVLAPRSLAVGRSSPGAVVGPEGEVEEVGASTGRAGVAPRKREAPAPSASPLTEPSLEPKDAGPRAP